MVNVVSAACRGVVNRLNLPATVETSQQRNHLEHTMNTATASVRNFHTDPGHGLLEVQRHELRDLGLLPKISAYSYQSGGTVYLEEDCDAGLYVEAMKAKGVKVTPREVGTNSDSFIRDLPSFVRTTGKSSMSADTLPVNKLGVDFDTRLGVHLASQLMRLKSVSKVVDAGGYVEDPSISKIYVATTMTESELDAWICGRKDLCMALHGTFTIASTTA